MSGGAISPRQLTRRLFERAAVLGDTRDGVLPISGTPDGIGLAIVAVSEHACRSLSRSLGPAGFNALLRRALANAEADHPLLRDIRIGRNADLIFGDMTELVQIHGASAVAAALEAALETMFGLLGRLIGDDMVARLVERSSTSERYDDEDEK
jgi:hypothetical protein